MLKKKKITEDVVENFGNYLRGEEKSEATVEKYTRDVRKFQKFLGGGYIEKETAVRYKEYLTGRYTPASVNSMIAALNCFFRYAGMQECCVKAIRIQKQIFASEDRELNKEEYQRLISAARDVKTRLMIQTICGTGIRVSELKYITVEAAYSGRAVVNCKNKTRVIFIPLYVRDCLIPYIKKAGITTGPVFISKNGNPLDRSSIWKRMKKLCERAEVDSTKVFPHNLRHLFARTFYSIDGDIVRLADVLGHSSINTTRIYTMETGRQHMDMIDEVQHVLTT